MDDRRHATPHGVLGGDGETARAHKLHGRAVAHAAARERTPRPQQFVLAPREEPRARAHVFDEQQLAVRPKHACDLPQRAFGVLDGAEHERRNDCVHGRIGQR